MTLDDLPQSLVEILSFLARMEKKVSVQYKTGLKESGYIVFRDDQYLIANTPESEGTNFFDKIVEISGFNTIYWNISRDEPILWIHDQ